MAHHFQAYPAGRSGAGLLLLRISLLSSFAAAQATGTAMPVLLTGLAILLLLGAGTRAAAVISGIVIAIVLGQASAPVPSLVGPLLSSAALAMIGPGAFSIDALRFGRRTVRLDRPSDPKA